MATLGIRYAFSLQQLGTGVATVMTALPFLIPLVILPLRRLGGGSSDDLPFARPPRRHRPFVDDTQRRLLRGPASPDGGRLPGGGRGDPDLDAAPHLLHGDAGTHPVSDAFAGRFWPDHPTLENFRIVLGQDHFFLQNFWPQLGNSIFVAVATMVMVLVVASLASFAIGRLKVRYGHVISNRRCSPT